MSKVWLMDYHFARGNFAFCHALLQEADESSEYAHQIRGRIHLAEKRANEALISFQRANAINPENGHNLHLIAQCLMMQGRYGKAVEALETGLSLSKDPNGTVHHDLACCYLSLKELARAEHHCREADKILPTKANYKLLTTCLVQQGKDIEAMEAFRCALRSFPKSSYFYSRFGRLCARKNLNDDALRALQAAVRLKPSNTIAVFELALIHQKMREFDEAIVQYRNVLQLDAGSAVSYNNLGLCYYHKNRFVAALTCLQRARDLHPTCGAVLFNLGLIYATLRQYCSAVVCWRSSDAEATPSFTAACLAKLAAP